ncbi:esterase-like activity of phytase family protein [Caulobacter segnis]|uniref:esterase-like activity of phytase family protein n=1 Tax=Caulobacter segnis TaxID=88688 RepID=UPI00240F980C|nr:esterase-like activity of phytase family protein [Caulobacter segnis]MDG2523595.1 esterase-like activity of phytase family protein [Caulobacter segnis]
MNRLVRLAVATAACGLMLAGCVPPETPPVLPVAPVPAGPQITVQSVAVPLNPNDPTQTKIGNFTYAGGIAITSSDSTRLHGLSTLTVLGDQRIMSASDDGDLFEARLVLDENDRLVGLKEAKIEPLLGLDGKPLSGKEWADAEGMTILPNGDRLVSFERNHRIWRYPAAGGAPVVAPSPQTIFPENEGMEALAYYPAAGADAYIVGGEEGEVWVCKLSGGCQSAPPQMGPDIAYGLVAVSAFNGPAVALMHRAYDPIQGNRIQVSLINDPTTKRRFPLVSDRFTLQAPLTRDNFEGLAVSSNRAGGVRLYLMSDDNFSARQRTLLLAFDWIPPPPQPAAPPPPPRKRAPVRR